MNQNRYFAFRHLLNSGCGLILAAVMFAVLSQLAFADPASCTITATPVNFGMYSVFSSAPDDNSGGGVRVDCNKNGNSHFDVTLSTGQSNRYSSRTMKLHANPLYYNLYTNAARTVVWGDGSGGSSVMNANRGGITVLSIFGQIPAGQDVAVGTYTDNITIAVNF